MEETLLNEIPQPVIESELETRGQRVLLMKEKREELKNNIL